MHFSLPSRELICFLLTDLNTIFFITQIFMFFQTLSQCSADDLCLKVKMKSLLGIEAIQGVSFSKRGSWAGRRSLQPQALRGVGTCVPSGRPPLEKIRISTNMGEKKKNPFAVFMGDFKWSKWGWVMKEWNLKVAVMKGLSCSVKTLPERQS